MCKATDDEEAKVGRSDASKEFTHSLFPKLVRDVGAAKRVRRPDFQQGILCVSDPSDLSRFAKAGFSNSHKVFVEHVARLLQKRFDCAEDVNRNGRQTG